MAAVCGGVKLDIPYGMMLTRICKHCKVLSDCQTSLKPTPLDKLIFGRMDDETIPFTRRQSQSRHRDEI